MVGPAGEGQSNSRGVGWEFVHVAIDDASRIAFSQILPDERKQSAVAFLEAALCYYAALSVAVAPSFRRCYGSCYRSRVFAKACRKHGLKHVRTKPYTPKTNGKAERFIQTALREWPMPSPIQPQITARPNCPFGCTATIGTDRTAA